MNFKNNGSDASTEVWTRPGDSVVSTDINAVCNAFEADIFSSCTALSPFEQAVARLAAMYSVRDEASMPREVMNALSVGVDSRAIAEVFLQCTIYVGCRDFAVRLKNLDTTLHALGAARPSEEIATAATLSEDSKNMRVVLHGARSDAGYANEDDPFTGALYKLTSLHGYGAIWTRPGLAIKPRMVCALACLSVLGATDTQAKFALSARDAGLNTKEICEAVTLSVPWIGSPRALQALTVMGRALSA